jgi:energy-coupling factor transport system substrate-specific component
LARPCTACWHCSASSSRGRTTSPSARRSPSSRSSATGLVGNAIADQLSGYGLLTAWNWHIANGLVGLLAGILAMGSLSRIGGNKIISSAVIAAVATAVGMLFVFTDIWVFGNDFNTALTGSYLWVLVPDLIASVILVPILALAWEPLKESLGR